MKRQSKWTQIYWDSTDSEMFAYVRFVPDFVNCEELGFPHGISLGGNRFKTKDEASLYADRLDKFFDAMLIASKRLTIELTGDNPR